MAVSLGSNEGDRMAHLRAGVGDLERLLEDVRHSRVYRTEPVGPGDLPPFLNLCLVGRSRLSPGPLLEELLAAEARRGRERRGGPEPRPRPLDADLLLYGGRVIDRPGLRVPHPRMAERAFVLVPLAEVAPGWRHPELDRTVEELRDRAGGEGVEPHRETV